MTLDVSKADNKDVLAVLINHFNYSMKELKSYDELTDSEKKFIPRKTAATIKFVKEPPRL